MVEEERIPAPEAARVGIESHPVVDPSVDPSVVAAQLAVR